MGSTLHRAKLCGLHRSQYLVHRSAVMPPKHSKQLCFIWWGSGQAGSQVATLNLQHGWQVQASIAKTWSAQLAKGMSTSRQLQVRQLHGHLLLSASL